MKIALLQHKEIVDMYNKGTSASKIAQIFSCCPNTIIKILRMYNIDFNRVSKEEEDEYIRLYVFEKQNAQKIANVFGRCNSVVLRHLKSRGVDIRSISETCKEEFNQGRDKQFGDRHPMWKGGKNRITIRNFIIRELKIKPICALCKIYDKSTPYHHIDGDITNNVKTNIIPLCPKHHQRVHRIIRFPKCELPYLGDDLN
jgi:hypothetical protein